MILLVPVSPEVPPQRAPRLWHALFSVLILFIAYDQTRSVLDADARYVSNLRSFIISTPDGRAALRDDAIEYLRFRPLLRITPSKGDWDLRRLLAANFVHGSALHLALNAVGTFAAVRICSIFIPFLCSVAIFLIGGSLGLFISLWMSSEISRYVPHLGASAGLFALLGTYYVYNFKFRTRYFFWFPSRHGRIHLRTSWFFFIDVLLLELVLSLSQFLPDHDDSVDHIAHVVGFTAGMALAVGLRSAQRWPHFLQTRGEFLYWSKLVRPAVFDPVLTPLATWLDLLQINPYNDVIKIKVCRILCKSLDMIGDTDVERAFRFFSPTFVRLHTREMSFVLLTMLDRERPIPAVWLLHTPYDSIIRLARYMAGPESLPLLLRLVRQYRVAHPDGGEVERKLERLLAQLSRVSPPPEANPADGAAARRGATARIDRTTRLR